MSGRPTLVSYAQNGEDVVLWRALGHVPGGRYVDVGANSPEVDSVTKLFYDRGWSGIDVEPLPELAEQLRKERERDVVLEAAVSRVDGGTVVLHEVPATGLSTLRREFVTADAAAEYGVRPLEVPSRSLQSIVDEHLPGEDVHFCKIDVEGAEAEVLASVDLTRWRPWVLVVEATRPNTAEPTHGEWEEGILAAGYRFCLFDGLSRWYVADEHPELVPALSYPACSLDGAVPAELHRARDEVHDLHQRLHQQHLELGERDERIRRLDAEAEALRGELVRWRGAVLERWAAAVDRATTPQVDEDARRELEAMRQTLSWRVTSPLRAVRSQQLKVRR